MDGWYDISTAPRDGTLIKIGADGEWFVMRWNPEAKNGIFPGVKGFWQVPDGSMTWCEEGGFGPTHWLPYERLN